MYEDARAGRRPRLSQVLVVGGSLLVAVALAGGAVAWATGDPGPAALTGVSAGGSPLGTASPTPAGGGRGAGVLDGVPGEPAAAADQGGG